jgi:hypothetical protein
LIAAFGPRAYFATLALLTGTLTIYDLWRKSRRQPVPLAQKGRFISAQPQGMTGPIVSYEGSVAAPGDAAPGAAALGTEGSRRAPE